MARRVSFRLIKIVPALRPKLGNSKTLSISAQSEIKWACLSFLNSDIVTDGQVAQRHTPKFGPLAIAVCLHQGFQEVDKLLAAIGLGLRKHMIVQLLGGDDIP